MGDWFQTLVAPDISAGDARSVGDRVLEWLIETGIVSPNKTDCVLGADLGHPPGTNYAKATVWEDTDLSQLWTNGLDVVTKRTVFYNGPDVATLTCPVCEARNSPPEGWLEAVGEWYAQRGSGELCCPACGASRSVVFWKHDPPWAFGHLGFQFWNWPTFNDEFLRTFEEQVGSRIVYVDGKL